MSSGTTSGLTRRQRAQRAANYRKRIKAGKAVTDEQRIELDQWDADKAARKPRTTKPPADKPPADKPPADKPPVQAAGEAPPDKPPVDKPPPKAPPEAPPKAATAQRTGRGDWRAKYGGGPAMGREMTCVLFAGAWKKIMMRCNAYIAAENDGKPMFSEAELDAEFVGAAVLTADALLPADFEITPPMIVAVGTSMIVTKTVLVARAKKKRKADGKSDDKRDAGSRALRKADVADVVDINTGEKHDAPESPGGPAETEAVRGAGHRSVVDDASDDDVV